MAAPRCQACGSSEFVNQPGSDDHGRCVECRTFPTLGFRAVQWMEEMCVIPDREDAGLPFVPTTEQGTIFLHHYRIDPFAVLNPATGRWQRFWFYPRGSQIEKPQKWGKAPISSAWVCFEAAPDGEAVFDGWDANGAPVGRPWPTPHLQVTAVSEDQTDNVWRVLLPMIQLGPLADVFPDTGLTRINLPTGGLIEPVTAAALSRLGQRITGAVQDQTESWHRSNGGHKLADNQRRGLAGTGGRFLSTPNAWDPTEDSVAQRTAESAASGVYQSYKEPPPGSVRNKRERRKVLQAVYGDSLIERGGWVDLDRIDVEIEALLEHDPAQGERWFMNRRNASEGAAFDITAWKAKRKPKRVARDATVVIGVDGALHDDALAVVAAEVKTGYVWPVRIWERPKDAGPDYEHPRHEVDQAVREVFDSFVVWRLYADDQWIESLLEGWQNTYGEKRVVRWMTYRPRQIAWAVRNFEQAIARAPGKPDSTGRPPLTHSGDETLTAHVANSRRRKLSVLDDRERPMHTLAKPAQHSPLKIDGAMAAVLAWEALGDAIAAGAVWMGDDPPATPDPPPAAGWKPGMGPDLAELSLAGHGAGPGDLS